ncbi:F0F1 ATP synthase subunit gamma [Patescibacteria group bacterium]|nr:F0F1 ATP synthase subunit gamma [Patescibacteria group bacterium]MBU1970337.1 F0F1 ATP synthase subunit gamma [Patescibacteria group bacterium]
MTNKEIDSYITSLESIGNITDTYQQIASMRMRKIKDSVLQNRAFYEPLLQTYRDISNIYVKIYQKPFKQEANGKSLAVLISSNTGLYGGVVKAVFDLFVKDHEHSKFDLAVTGRLGRGWLDSLAIAKPYTYYELPDEISGESTSVKELFGKIAAYSEIWVYHGIFNTIMDQSPKVTKIAQNYSSEPAEQQAATPIYLFEPSIESILENFEKQLLFSFFDQSIYESSLAKYGSRMISLDAAGQNISRATAAAKLTRTRYRHLKQNKKQLEQSSAFLVRRGG